jgi:hypothetical protein
MESGTSFTSCRACPDHHPGHDLVDSLSIDSTSETVGTLYLQAELLNRRVAMRATRSCEDW